MKTRENELHEPKIDAYKTPVAALSVLPVFQTVYQVGYECAVCGNGHAELVMEWCKEWAIKRFKLNMDNYCPRCGARMKEMPYANL